LYTHKLANGFKYYLHLHFKIAWRAIRHFGLHPLLGFLLIVLVVAGAAIAVSIKTNYAPYIFFTTTCYILWMAADIKRIAFIKLIFGSGNFISVRLFENVIICLPLLLLLFILKCLLVLLLPIIVIVFAVAVTGKSSIATPTPFYNYPFEFIIGFRKNVATIFILYLLTAISIAYNNYNLGLFALMAHYILCMSFYQDAENPFYVWIYNESPNSFIFKKLCTANILAVVLALPVIVMLLYFTTSFWQTLFFVVASQIFLTTFIVARYASYPQNVQLPAIIILSLCVYQPPLLLFAIPYYFLIARKKLKLLLPC